MGTTIHLGGYRGLTVWQKSDELAYQVYMVTKHFPTGEMFGLTSQMRRYAISVPANLVEGYGRNTMKDKLHFRYIARGSLTELEYYIDFAFRMKYITSDSYDKLVALRSEVGRLLSGYMQSMR